MSKPVIQIGDEIREMTDEEYAAYQERLANDTLPALIPESSVEESAPETPEPTE